MVAGYWFQNAEYFFKLPPYCSFKEKEFYQLLRVIAFWTIPTGDDEFFKLTTSWEEY